MDQNIRLGIVKSIPALVFNEASTTNPEDLSQKAWSDKTVDGICIQVLIELSKMIWDRPFDGSEKGLQFLPKEMLGILRQVQQRDEIVKNWHETKKATLKMALVSNRKTPNWMVLTL